MWLYLKRPKEMFWVTWLKTRLWPEHVIFNEISLNKEAHLQSHCSTNASILFCDCLHISTTDSEKILISRTQSFKAGEGGETDTQIPNKNQINPPEISLHLRHSYSANNEKGRDSLVKARWSIASTFKGCHFCYRFEAVWKQRPELLETVAVCVVKVKE